MSAQSVEAQGVETKRRRRIGILLVVGLAVQGASLLSATPGAFLLFAGVGCTLVGLGLVLYLLSLLKEA